MPSDKSDFIPNSFQTPNIYVDAYLHLLTGEEWKVMTYAIRRILGFHKRSDRISLSQFAKGIQDKNGRYLDHGCGVNVDTVRSVLARLCDYGFLIRLQENDPTLNTGPEYSLQLDDAKISLTKILFRMQANKKENTRKTLRARRAIAGKRKQYPLLSDNTTPLLSDNTTPPIVGQTHNILEETKGKPEYIAPALEEIEFLTVVQVLQLPEIKLYEMVTNRFPGQHQWPIIVEFIRLHNPDIETMKNCWKEWVKRDYRSGNLGWLDWCVNGIEERHNGKTGQSKNGNQKRADKKGRGDGRILPAPVSDADKKLAARIRAKQDDADV